MRRAETCRPCFASLRSASHGRRVICHDGLRDPPAKRHLQPLATPLLFRYLNLDAKFPIFSRLRGFARHAQLRSTKGDAICSLLRSIKFHPKLDLAAAEVSDMAYILLNANNLSSLMLGPGARPSMLFMAIHSASSSLQFLRIFVKDDVLLDAQHIGQLKRLKSLEVVSIADWSKVYMFWDLPCLTSLEWEGYDNDRNMPTCKGDLIFLNQCQFPALMDLTIRFLRDGNPAPVDLAAFRKLVKKKMLISISTVLLPEQAKALLPHALALIVNLNGSPFTPEMAGCLNVRTELIAGCVAEGNLDGWLQFLSTMCTLVRTDNPKLRLVKVFSKLSYLPVFTWGFEDASMLDMSPEAAQFMGRMLGFAVRLKSRGIDLLDVRGIRFDGTKFKAA
jgi:hypothetical protein